MQRTMLKSKLHRATVTHSELEYEGSCAIDSSLLRAADIKEYEQISIYNITNGERFVTYAIRAEKDSGIISINGAAAHKASPGDKLIIATYAYYNESELETYHPTLVYLDESNKMTITKIRLQFKQLKFGFNVKYKKTVISALEDIKAFDIVSLDVKKLTSISDFMIIASASSTRQTKALARNIKDKMSASGVEVIGIEGENEGDWVLVDLGDIIVHIMTPTTRAYFNLEEFMVKLKYWIYSQREN